MFSFKKTWLRWGVMLKTCGCHSHSHADHDEQEEWPLLFALAGSCLVFGLLGLVFDSYFHAFSVSLVFYILAYLSGGWDAAIDTWGLLKKRELDIHFLMLAVAAGAASIGSWREGALLLFLFSASGAMESFAMGRTKKAIDALFRGAPKTARVLRDGKEEQLSIEALLPGMIVLVTTGEQIPADLEIVKGESACDESNLTGEAMPVKKMPGDTALSGTINLWGVIEGRVLRPASESSLQKIIRLIQEAQKLKAPSQRFTDRFGTSYTLLILTLCTIMFFVWWLILKYPPFFSNGTIASSFYRTMTLLVVASPCALVISVPSAILSAIASGARRGILYRGGAAIETLSKVSVVALDKTGTITSGNLTLSNMEYFQGTEEQFKTIAYNLARLSEHPLSRAIRRTAATWNLPIKEVEKFETLLGLGVKATIDGTPYVMGSSRLVQQLNLSSTSTFNFNSCAAAQGAVVWIAGDHLLGRMLFTDDIREEAAVTLQQLHRDGLRTVMLTGDHPAAAKMTGNKVGVGTILSELSPTEKVAAIEKLKQGGRVHVAMIGDGVNDAPCLAAADVGVAMGARGSDAALEQAEIVLMNDRLENFLLARRISQKARRIIYQNITVALGTVLVMVTTAALISIPLTLGVAAHEGSTLLVVLNSLRLLRLQLPKKF
ncbi:MAG: cadmium-translocating P-type ATPase [Chthoniobacterales bacterium]|nr:cadmium-translocating P-type ATPase [Chthoniobacterales bacterium]